MWEREKQMNHRDGKLSSSIRVVRKLNELNVVEVVAANSIHNLKGI